jgi:acyl-CoA synthetase (AMP-forming)/AMP-acid ligase II
MKFINTSSANVLTDGQLSCSYQDIPAVFAQLTRFFAKNNLSSKDCIVLQCENSLPAALVLLFLLEHDISFLLSKEENSSQALPDFCRYQLQIDALSLEPETFLTLTKLPVPATYPRPEEAFVYLRSSGSTGEPKIIAHSQAKLHANILNCVERLGFDGQTRLALPVPISHLFGLGAGFLPAVSVGAAVDLQKGANIIRYLQREKTFNPNTVLMTPIFCETLLKGRKTPRPYRLTVIAGDCLRCATFASYEALFGCVVQLYGSTEMGAIAAGNPGDSAGIRSEFIGLPMPDVQLKIDKTGAAMNDADENSGELCCQRQYGFEACLNQQGETVNLSQMDAAGWFATRDLGQISANGYIKVLGRCDHSVKRDGLLVLFVDIEIALQAIKGIKAAAVVAHGESLRGKGLIAYCVVEDTLLNAAEIRSRCFDLLPRRAIPDQVMLIDHLPVLDNGKIDRLSLLRMVDKYKFS